MIEDDIRCILCDEPIDGITDQQRKGLRDGTIIGMECERCADIPNDTMTTVIITKEVLIELKYWLLRREYDIANSIEDFGCLKDVFHNIVRRPASDR